MQVVLNALSSGIKGTSADRVRCHRRTAKAPCLFFGGGLIKRLKNSIVVINLSSATCVDYIHYKLPIVHRINNAIISNAEPQ